MARDNRHDSPLDVDPTDPEDVMEAVEPQIRDGPFGMPVLVPRSAPGLPMTDDE